MKNKSSVIFLKALANDDRLEIVKLLKTNGETCANELQKSFFLEQSSFSFHLKVLKRSGVVTCRRDGRHQLYKLSSREKWDAVSDVLGL